MKNLFFVVLLAAGLAAFAEDKLIPNAGDSHDYDINALVFSPDGKNLVSAGQDGTAVVWDAASGKRLKTSPKESTIINALAVSPDGSLIASTDSEKKSVHLWDSASMQVKHSFIDHRFEQWRLAFSSDGKYLASCSLSDEHVFLYGLDDMRKSPMKLKINTPNLRDLVFSKDGSLLYTISKGGVLSVIDMAKKTVVKSAQLVQGAGVNFFCVSEEKKYIALGCGDKRVYIYDFETLKPKHSLWHGSAVRSLAMSPDGRYVLSGGFDSQVIRWDPATGKATGTHKAFLGEPITSIAFTPDGSRFACSSGKIIKTFETEKGTSLRLWMKER